MSKTAKVLQLISLLTRRQLVTMKDIKTVCGIPERTAYRYLNTISELDIPVFYDREKHGYCLSRTVSYADPQFDADEHVMLQLALALLSERVRTTQSDRIDRLKSKLLAMSPVRIENMLSNLATTKLSESEDLVPALNELLIHVSINENAELELLVGGKDRPAEKISISRPSLTFDGEWRVTSLNDEKKVSIPFSEISHASVRRVM